MDVADSQHGPARRLHQVTWPVSTNWNASSPDSQSWKAMSRIAGDSPRFPGNLTTPGSSHRPYCFCFCLGFPGWTGLCLFCQHSSFLTTYKALVMFGSRVRLLPSDPDADRLKWSGCHFLCPHPPPAPSHLLILHPLSMPFIILITTVTFPLPLSPQNQSSILWTLCPRGWLSCAALDVSVWQFDRICKSKISTTSTSFCCYHLWLNPKDEQLFDILKHSKKKHFLECRLI